MPEDGDLRAFPTTHWSLICRAGQEGSVGQRPALDQLLRRYLPALRAHLASDAKLAAGQIDDILQGFVCSRILEHDLVASATNSKGKFRTLLLTSLDRYVVSHFRHLSAQKRSGNLVSLENMGNQVPAPPRQAGPSEFDLAWARQILKETLLRMQEACRAEGRAYLWDVFQARILGPALEDTPPVEYEQIVQQFGLESLPQARNGLISARRMFVRILRSVIGEYAEDEAAIDAELRDLRQLLLGGGA